MGNRYGDRFIIIVHDQFGRSFLGKIYDVSGRVIIKILRGWCLASREYVYSDFQSFFLFAKCEEAKMEIQASNFQI